MATVDAIELETKVKDRYRHVASSRTARTTSKRGMRWPNALGYPADLLDRIPGEAIESFAGSATSSTTSQPSSQGDVLAPMGQRTDSRGA
jgi:hypothetical protein